MCRRKDALMKAAKAYDKFVSRLLRVGYIDRLSQEEVEMLVRIDPKRRPRYRHPLTEELADAGWTNIAWFPENDVLIRRGSNNG